MAASSVEPENAAKRAQELNRTLREVIACGRQNLNVVLKCWLTMMLLLEV
jgi:hypothetical protein